jgi:hypothetical protein
MKDQDGLTAEKKKYEENAKPYSELEQDAGGLGKTKTDYESKRRSRAGGQVGTQNEGRHAAKARDKYRGGE